jgi:hypothetical protein
MAVGLVMGIENECSAKKIPTNLRLSVFRTRIFFQIFFVGWVYARGGLTCCT